MTALPVVGSPTVDAVEAAVVANASQRFQNRISGGQIGKPCERAIWYQYRWAQLPETFEGRMLRLFETGHVEEARMIGWLQLAGCDVQDRNPETGEQWEVTDLDGHFVGKLDGIVTGLMEAPKTPHLLECKTCNARSFAQLKKHGVAVAKPEHVAQMQVYMHLKGLSRAFYLAKHKDTDELYAERIAYDQMHALALLAKAETIRDADSAPARISDDPDYYLCRSFGCPSYNICHADQLALRNCRTCLHSRPINDGQWYCQRHERELSTEDQQAGCPSHLYLPSLVPGEQIDADEKCETVTYRMTDGSEWVDGERRRYDAAKDAQGSYYAAIEAKRQRGDTHWPARKDGAA